MACDLETAVSTWRHQYKYNAAFKGRDLDELERHVRDHVEWLENQGLDTEQAFRQAVAELGNQVETESDFRAVAFMKTRDRGEVGTEIRAVFSMIANYGRVALRNLVKNKTGSVINVVSLSLASAVALVAFLYTSSMLTRNYFHEHADSIYLVHQVDADGQWWGHSPTALAPAILQDIPGVVQAIRVTGNTVKVVIGDVTHTVPASYVDPGFLDTFTFPLAMGSKDALQRKGQVILSANMAETMFGQENPVGRQLALQTGPGSERLLTVAGVAEPFPLNTSFSFDLLMPLDAANASRESWDAFVAATFIRLQSPELAPDVERALAAYVEPVNAASDDWHIQALRLDGLKDLAWNRDNVRQSVIGHIPWAPVVVLSGIAMLLLLLACFNYMNISLATSSRRLKEIGVRKVMGARRLQVMSQFFMENVLLCLFALGIGLLLAAGVVIPAFNELSGMGLELNLLENARLWIFIVLLVTGAGLLSGAYPALYISSFRPTVIFRGRERFARRRPVTFTIQGAQFLVVFLLILAGIVLTMNARYHEQRDWGYATANRLVYNVYDDESLHVIMDLLQAQPSVSQVATTQEVIGFSENWVEAEIDDRKMDVIHYGVSRTYLGLLDLDPISGTGFTGTDGAPGTESVLVNESFVRRAGLDAPLASRVTVDSVDYAIAGVVPDFNARDFFSVIQPAVFRLTPDSTHHHITVLTAEGAGMATATAISNEWSKRHPGTEPDMHFQDDAFRDFFEESAGITNIFRFVGTISLLISCLSLYALSSQNVVSHMKEIGMRKVLGGSPGSIVGRVNRNITITLLVAAGVGVPIGYVLLNALLDSIFAYHMPLGPAPFVITGLILLMTASATVAIQIRSIRRAQPATILRSE